jgi:hypothetical protein
MGAGLFVAFYMVHMRLWVITVKNAENELVLWVGGQANKNKDRFEQKFDEVVEGIRAEVERAAIAPRSAHKKKEEAAELTLVATK